ncbi:MAG: P-loop ATPase, Sll1717 family [Salibacteraceae bacterium]
MNLPGLNHPFGEECCEYEIEVLQQNYSSYYFNEAPFNRDALETSTYLIVGRRGTGKSSLAEYFKFQRELKNAYCIDVDEPSVYQKILTEVSKMAGASPELARLKLVKVWEFVLWSLIFHRYKSESEAAKAASLLALPKGPSKMISILLKSLLNKFLQDEGELSDELEQFVSSDLMIKAREEVLTIARNKPVIIAIDTLERHDLDDLPMLQAISALIQCASQLNVKYAFRGIHIKAFIPAEVFPFIAESGVANTAKFIREPVFLNWRPKDLVKLVSWRYFLYLNNRNLLPQKNQQINWNSFKDVHQKIWIPHFGEEQKNHLGRFEKTFPYVLRHTQMRPRQLVIILNKIARLSKRQGGFPFFDQEMIRQGILEAEMELATEVINSYSRIYPGLPRILDAIRGFPTVFKGNQLDRYAPRTKSAWIKGNYSTYRFKQILSELGIVGELRHWDERTHILSADFEYHRRDRLVLNSDSYYVLHPMFSQKLQISNEKSVMVYPFPDHPDFGEM